MKKALIALTVAAGMVSAAHANSTTLYGSLGVQTAFVKLAGQSASDNRWNLETYSSNFGIKGEEELSNGLTAFYKMEFGFNPNGGVNNTRYAFVGLKGDFGQVTLGKQDSLYKKATTYTDIFESTPYFDNGYFGGETGGSRIAKVISYVSPDIKGVHFGLAGVLDGNHDIVGTSASKGFTGFQAAAWYGDADENGLFAGVAYSQLQTKPNATKVFGGSVGYKTDDFKVGFGADHRNKATVGDGANALYLAKGEVYSLAGEYYMDDNTFRAGVTYRDIKGAKAMYSAALGYQYNLSKRTYAWVEGQYDRDNNNTSNKDGYSVLVGLRHKF